VAYHASETARDRDRLRQQVLEARGWTILRIWSTDWFKDRAGSIERILAAVDTLRRNAALEVEEAARSAERDLAARAKEERGASERPARRQQEGAEIPVQRPGVEYQRREGPPYHMAPGEGTHAGSALLD